MKFKPEDFDGCWNKLKAVTYQDAAELANKKLQQWLSEAPIVSGKLPDHPRWTYEMEFKGVVEQTHTHVARIVDIQVIDSKK